MQTCHAELPGAKAASHFSSHVSGRATSLGVVGRGVTWGGKTLPGVLGRGGGGMRGVSSGVSWPQIRYAHSSKWYPAAAHSSMQHSSMQS